MNKKIFFGVFASVLMIALVVGVSAENYSYAVFRPSGVLYSINVRMGYLEVSNVTYNYTVVVDGILGLNSRDFDLNYVGWGFYLNLTRSVFEDGALKDYSNISLPIPPLFVANKVGTRELHATDVLVDFLSGKYQEADLNSIAQSVYEAKPIENIYIYNVFFIPTDVNVGSEIPYGIINKTGEKYVKNFPIDGKREVSLGIGKYDAWFLNISLSELDFLTDLINSDVNITGFYFGVYYECRTGWLLSVQLAFNNTVEENETTKYYFLEGSIDLSDPGNVLTQASYLNKVIGLPAYSMEIISTGLVILAVVRFLRRK